MQASDNARVRLANCMVIRDVNAYAVCLVWSSNTVHVGLFCVFVNCTMERQDLPKVPESVKAEENAEKEKAGKEKKEPCREMSKCSYEVAMRILADRQLQVRMAMVQEVTCNLHKEHNAIKNALKHHKEIIRGEGGEVPEGWE